MTKYFRFLTFGRNVHLLTLILRVLIKQYTFTSSTGNPFSWESQKIEKTLYIEYSTSQKYKF